MRPFCQSLPPGSTRPPRFGCCCLQRSSQHTAARPTWLLFVAVWRSTCEKACCRCALPWRSGCELNARSSCEEARALPCQAMGDYARVVKAGSANRGTACLRHAVQRCLQAWRQVLGSFVFVSDLCKHARTASRLHSLRVFLVTWLKATSPDDLVRCGGWHVPTAKSCQHVQLDLPQDRTQEYECVLPLKVLAPCCGTRPPRAVPACCGNPTNGRRRLHVRAGIAANAGCSTQ